jgi:methylated-DNA-[protein]-cysteine S-methyltransferase
MQNSVEHVIELTASTGWRSSLKTGDNARMKLEMDSFQSPLGQVILVARDSELVFVDFEGNEKRMRRLLEARFGAYRLEKSSLPNFKSKLEAYFSGDLEAMITLKVSTGGTEFQARVWQALCEIPTGQTMSYGALAAKLDKPGASRAVGMINGLNPISIVLPCHRVIGANGTLTGYAGGLERKKWLLEHEGVKLKGSSPRANLDLQSSLFELEALT